METKKISFGFIKTKKQEKPEVVEKRDYIDCVEEKSIKVIGGEAVKEDVPLVIPMKPNSLVTAERLKEIAEKVESALDDSVVVKNESVPNEKPSENETLEQMAARELLQEAKQKKVVEQPMFMVPLPAKSVVDGEKESTLDDYESVPVQEFGLAMLRGMGWTPGQEQSKFKQPQLRPKGLGLGADKVVTENQKKKTSKEKDEELAIVTGSYIKVTAGKYNGCYGKVVSLDEDNGRVMIELAMKKETVSLSEFMMQAVTKSEFDKLSKVLNADSYLEYKKKESEGSKNVKEQKKMTSMEGTSSHKTNDVSSRGNTKDRGRRKDERYKDYDEDKHSNGRNKDKGERVSSHRRHNSSSDEETSRSSKRKDKKVYSSNDSLSSDYERKDRKDRIRKKRHSSTSSNESGAEDNRKPHKSKSSKSSKEKRDIDKKRKGKKKKRDRDRSPYHRKHKK